MRTTSRRHVVLGTAATALSTAALAQDHPPDVLIVGAGLSGLYTGLLLEEQGLKVQVLEAKQRVGGRLCTLDNIYGKPEAGGVSIGADYARLLELAKRFQLKLIPERLRTTPRAETTALYYDDQAITFADWATSPHNPFPEPYKKLRPFDLPWGLPQNLNVLRSLEDWQDPKFASADISAAAFFAKQGFSPAALRAAEATLGYGNGLDNLSIIHLMHVWRFLLQSLPGTFAIEGGMQRLPEAMARGLNTPVQFGAALRAVRHDPFSVRIQLQNGETLTARALVITAPVPALRRIKLDPLLSGPQAEAIATMDYHAVTMFYFAAERKFWEADGIPPGVWGEHVAERFMPLPYDAAGHVVAGTDPKLFIAYVNGRQAQRLDQQAENDALRTVLDDLARIRPSTQGALKPLTSVSWQNDPFAGGAYASWAPGQCGRLAPALPKPAGRVFFAGEHTAISSRGMEAALESAERATVEVLTSLN